MYCVACGAENPTAALFCANCNTALAAHCSHCRAELPPGARFCPACGQPAKAADPDSLAKEAARHSPSERKQVTVLFADFAGFTAFAHRRDAEEVRDYMGSVWTKLDGIIATHGGVIEKHIGDAVMAVFGAKQAREDDPVQAVRAALAMQVCLGQFQPEGKQPVLQMRIGIHTGFVVVGPLGSSGEFTATGDTVNLASRLEEGAPIGGVLVSHETYRHVYGMFDVQSLPPCAVSGRPELVQTYLILRAKPRGLALQLRGVEGVETRMIGRERELKRLQSALQQVIQSGESQVFVIVGEAGIGKSCLLRELQKWIELLPETIRFFCGRATAESAGLPYSLMRDVFCARFEIQDSDSPALAREKLERGLVGLLQESLESKVAGDFPFEEPQTHAHFIGQLLGLDFSSSPWLRDILTDTNQIKHHAFRSFDRFFTAISRSLSAGAGASGVKAAILVAEDVHWSDDGSLELLAHLSRACRQVPLLIVCLTRPELFERRSSWAEGMASCSRMDLEPLSRRDSLALVESIMHKTPQIPQALRELVVGSAEGVPFYIEEIIKMLIDQKVIVPGEEQWRVASERLAAAHVPPTLTGVLQARLDSLLPVERLVLQRASVVGRVFWDNAVEQLSSSTDQPLKKGEILVALAGLRRKELIFSRESSAFAGVNEYSFKHELLRNVAYESLLKKSRRSHHEQVAAWLIGQSGERSNEVAGLIAGHFEHAGRLSDSAVWFGRAGQQARVGYAPAIAIDYFRKALALLPAPVSPEEKMEFQMKRLEWYECLGEVLGTQARFDEAVKVFDELRVLAEACSNRVLQARAWNGRAFVDERLGKNRASVECAERAEILAREAGEVGRGERVRALLLKGWAFYRISDAAAVLALGEQTQALCLEYGNRHGLATSFKLLGVAHLQLGHYQDADHFFKKGLTLYQELGDRRNTAAMLSNLGESARLRGDFSAAEGLYEKALATVRQTGHRESEAIYLSNLSAARLGLQKFKQVETDLREAISLTGGANFCALSATYSFLSEACSGQGKFSEAVNAAQRALALARESENDLDLGTAWRALGRAVLTADRPTGNIVSPESIPRADVCFAESLRVFKQINAEGEHACTLLAWAEFDLQQGQTESGRRKAEEARTVFQRLGSVPEVARTEALLQGAQLAQRPGDETEQGQSKPGARRRNP